MGEDVPCGAFGRMEKARTKLSASVSQTLITQRNVAAVTTQSLGLGWGATLFPEKPAAVRGMNTAGRLAPSPAADSTSLLIRKSFQALEAGSLPLMIPVLFSDEECFAFPSLSWGQTHFPLHIAGSKPGGKRKSLPGPEGAVVNS